LVTCMRCNLAVCNGSNGEMSPWKTETSTVLRALQKFVLVDPKSLVASTE